MAGLCGTARGLSGGRLSVVVAVGQREERRERRRERESGGRGERSVKEGGGRDQDKRQKR